MPASPHDTPHDPPGTVTHVQRTSLACEQISRGVHGSVGCIDALIEQEGQDARQAMA